MDLTTKYIYLLIAGFIVLYPVAAYCYYRLTKVVLSKFEDSFVTVNINRLAKTAVLCYFLLFAIFGAVQEFYFKDTLPVDLNYVLVALAAVFVWFKLDFKEGETKSKLLVVLHLILSPSILCAILFAGWAAIVVLAVKLIYGF